MVLRRIAKAKDDGVYLVSNLHILVALRAEMVERRADRFSRSHREGTQVPSGGQLRLSESDGL